MTVGAPSLTHANTFHLLQVNSNWLLTFTYPQMRWNQAAAQNAYYSVCDTPPH